MLQLIQQLIFDLGNPAPTPPLPEPKANPVALPKEAAPPLAESSSSPPSQAHGRAPELEAQCHQLLSRLGILTGHDTLTVEWNARLRSTAGYARYPAWTIELNPRLQQFPGESDRTLRHELAHLIAYHRAGRRRIEPHGNEWRRACADLGIPNESPKHRLPLPRNTIARGYAYQCPNCKTIIHRVRPFKHPSACLTCCRKHAGGNFEPSFKFVRVVSEA